MDSMTSCSPRERVYNAFFDALYKKGLAPPLRHQVRTKELDAVVKLVEGIQGADIESFIEAQFYGMTPLECSRISLSYIGRYENRKKSIDKYSSYLLKYGHGTDYRAETLRLNATVAYYARSWKCTEQEVLADPDIPLPSWYRYIRTEDKDLKRLYGETARKDITNETFIKAMKELGYAN